jgi:hypothetical protein
MPGDFFAYLATDFAPPESSRWRMQASESIDGFLGEMVEDKR